MVYPRAACAAIGQQPRMVRRSSPAEADPPRRPAHPFCEKRNPTLSEAGFDRLAERLCAKYHDPRLGRPLAAAGRLLPLLPDRLLRGSGFGAGRRLLNDGRTHLAYKAEQAVDLETGAAVAGTVQEAGRRDSQSLRQTPGEAAAR